MKNFKNAKEVVKFVPELDDDSAEEVTDSTKEVKSKMEEFLTFMSGLAFEHNSKPLIDGTIEHFKNYLDPNGRVARVRVVTNKDAVGLEPDHPDYFTVTIQLHIKADELDVERKAPEFCKSELLHILSKFDSTELETVNHVKCSECGIQTEDQLMGRCLDCARRLT